MGASGASKERKRKRAEEAASRGRMAKKMLYKNAVAVAKEARGPQAGHKTKEARKA